MPTFGMGIFQVSDLHTELNKRPGLEEPRDIEHGSKDSFIATVELRLASIRDGLQAVY